MKIQIWNTGQTVQLVQPLVPIQRQKPRARWSQEKDVSVKKDLYSVTISVLGWPSVDVQTTRENITRYVFSDNKSVRVAECSCANT